ncbi:MAG: hypothetical protein WEK74_11630 [Hydrogenophaga sp.]
MLWRRATRLQPLRPAQPVPQGESVRAAALQAAWRRDLWVSRRRIWWRWTLWGAQRYGGPEAGVAGVLVGLWFAVAALIGWVQTPAPSKPDMAAAPAAPYKTLPTEESPRSSDTSAQALSSASGMKLKLEPALRAAANAQIPVSSPTSSEAAEIPNPQLISENWLHSKEP